MIMTWEKRNNRRKKYPSITSFTKPPIAVGLQPGCHSQRVATERRQNYKNISYSFAI
jgi:hypothetical protein